MGEKTLKWASLLAIAAVFLINSVTVFAQWERPERDRPERDRGERDGRNDRADSAELQVRTILNNIRAETSVPGITAAVLTGDMITSSAVGVKRIDQPALVRKNDKFHIGSVSKSVTSTIAAKLVELRLIRWQTTVIEAFPEFANEINPALRNVTLEQLLRHRGGVAGFVAGEELLSANRFTGTPVQQRYSLAKELLTQPPAFPVGSFNYSNAGYGIAASMLERAARSDWETIVRIGFFRQFEAEAIVGWPAFKNPNQPFGHFEEGTIYSVPGTPFVPHDPNDPANLYSVFPPALSPSGNISLDAQDLAKYAQVHLRGLMGLNTSLLRSASIVRLHTPDSGPIAGDVFYSSGWLEGKLNGVPTSTHSGSADTFFCVVVIQASRGKAAVAIVNSGGERGENAAYHAVERLMGIGDLRSLGQIR